MKVVILGQSQHYAGLAFDVGQRLTPTQRTELRNVAVRSGVWSYVEPEYLTPTWVHFDKRRGTSSCVAGGYPTVRAGSKGAYVLILQDALNTLGFKSGSLDGIFGNNTHNAVTAYQRSKGLVQDGIVGCNTWTLLMRDIVGRGRSSTTID